MIKMINVNENTSSIFYNKNSSAVFIGTECVWGGKTSTTLITGISFMTRFNKAATQFIRSITPPPITK